ncbi:MAG: VWA domain-containing protein [Phycisphaerales bacterium]|nr:VWA domain-containing protein [Phycisphaerales bacterium]
MSLSRLRIHPAIVVACALATMGVLCAVALVGCANESVRYSTSAGRARAQEAAAGFAAGERSGVPVIDGPFDEVWVLARDGNGPRQAAPSSGADEIPGTGALVAIDTVNGNERRVPMPLTSTAVEAQLAGPVSSVTVRQRFENPFNGKIEAVYVFPLPDDAAVSDFVMTIGDRRIRGIIREREEAERAYAEARSAGYVAALLTEERPNVFTQKVANIEPGKAIDVELVYYGVLPYLDGWQEFVFPMVVGPRFNPPGSSGGIGAVSRGAVGASGQPTDVSYLAPGESTAHRISIDVAIDAGTDILDIASPSHAIDVDRSPGEPGVARVRLAAENEVPNRDFVLRYRLAGDAPVAALVSSRDPGRGDGHFALTIYPPAAANAGVPTPLELVFVIDCSGSMSGVPLNQAKAAVRTALGRLHQGDTFQLIQFSDSASTFGTRPVAVNEETVAAAMRHLDGLQSEGGTMMIEGVRTALSFPHDPERLRYVVFLTDGYIGNEREIMGEVEQLLGSSRIFSFGIGSSVNRFLLAGMATSGRGTMTVLLDREDARTVMESFMDRVRRPVMHDLSIDWSGLAVAETYPRRLPDLLAGRPVTVTGRCNHIGPATIAIDGRIGTQAVHVPVEVAFADNTTTPALRQVWARAQIADLSREAILGDAAEAAQRITAVALQYNLMSPYTAFLAIDSSRVTEGDHGTTVHQAVPVPQGVRYDTTVSDGNSAVSAPGTTTRSEIR